MKIVSNVLAEIGYILTDSFEVTYESQKARGSFSFRIQVFLSSNQKKQAFLVVECKESELFCFAETEDNNLIESIAYMYRTLECSGQDLDKNTSLLILSQQDVERDLSSTIRIEDDPYYFKKFVFSYTGEGLNEVDKLNIIEGEFVTYIQKIVFDPQRFSEFKKNNALMTENSNQDLVYSFMIELVVKISCFPLLEKQKKDEPKVVEDYITEADKEKLDMPIEKMLSFLEESEASKEDKTELDIDKVINAWNEIYEKG